MPRAGAEMQCTSCLPVCYTTKDLIVSANGSTWPLNNSDKTCKSGHGYNYLFPPCNSNQYLGCEKEVLRQTMLKHESVFKYQVHELHRLYRRQRELIDEIKRRELSRHHPEMNTSKSNPFFSQKVSESSQKTCHIPTLPLVNPACNWPSALFTEKFQAPSSFVAGKSMQAGPNTSLYTTSSLKDLRLLSSNSKKFGKRTLNLELPADEYIDSEEGERFEEENVSEVSKVPGHPPKEISDIFLQSDSKLSLCSGELNSSQGGAFMRHSILSETRNMFDLKNPIHLDKAATLYLTRHLGSDTCHTEIPHRKQELSENPNSSPQVLTKEIALSIQAGKYLEACSESMHRQKVDRQRELLYHTAEAGQNGSCLNPLLQDFPEKSPMSYVELQVRCPNLELLHKREFGSESTSLGTKNSEKNHDLLHQYNLRLVSPCIPASNQLVPLSNAAKSEPSSVSSQRKPTSNLRPVSIAVQALPCFNAPASLSKNSALSVGNSWLIGNKVQVNRNSTCGSSFQSVGSLQTSLSESLTLKSCPLSTNLNPLNCEVDNGYASEHHDLLNSMDVRSAKEPSSCLADLTVSLENKEREHLDLGFSKAFLTSGSDVERKRHGTSDSPDYKKMHGSFNFDKLSIASDQFSAIASSENPNLSENKDIENNDKTWVLDRGAHGLTLNTGKGCGEDDLVVDNGVDCKLSGFGNQIDLNSCLNEDDFAHGVMKSSADINLEAPVSPQNKESSPPRGNSEETQLETSVQLSKQEDGVPEDEFVVVAAEALYSISSSGFQLYMDNATREPSETSCDCLQWFAGIVSSMADNLKNEVETVLTGAADSNHNELLANRSDYFEAMTLKLTETKVEEYCCKSQDQKKKRTGATLLPSQPKRGRTRRAREQKDFQGEVLPCIASLSKHEVTEDLQIIGGLMKAAGTPLETDFRRKNGCRNGCRRGKKRPSISLSNTLSNVVESTMCSLLKQQTNDSKLGFLEGCLTSWGKINKRRRGQRFPARNFSLIFSRVN